MFLKRFTSKLPSRDAYTFLLLAAFISMTVFVSTLYAFLSIFGKVSMNLEILLTIFLSLLTIHFIMFKWMYRRSHFFPLRTLLVLLLWVGVIFWFWGFAPFFYLLVIQIDQSQFSVLALAFLWEVPTMGRIFIGLALLFFRPIQRYLENEEMDEETLRRVYQRVRKFPSLIALTLYILTVFGFIIGTLQLRYLVYMTTLEAAKAVLFGCVISLFLGVFFYLAVSRMLYGIRQRIKAKLHTSGTSTISARRKILVLTLVTVTSSFLFIDLIFFRSLQDVVKNQIITQLEQEEYETGAWFPLTDHNKRIQPVVSSVTFSGEEWEYIRSNERGVVENHTFISKIIAFRTDLFGQKEVRIIELLPYYRGLKDSVVAFLIAESVILFIVCAIVFFFTESYIGALAHLTSLLEGHRTSKKYTVSHHGIASGDELEEFSNRLVAFLHGVRRKRIKRNPEELASLPRKEI